MRRSLIRKAYDSGAGDLTSVVGPDARGLPTLASFVEDVNGVNGLNSFTISWDAFTNSDPIGYGYSVTPVPEPSGALLLGITGVLGILRRRRLA